MLIVIALCFSGCLGFYEVAEDKLQLTERALLANQVKSHAMISF